MKKLALLFSIVFCFLFAQDLLAQDSKKGFKIGLNSATLFGDDIEDNDPAIDWHIGGFYRLSPEGLITIQTELLYSRQGTDIDGDRLTLSYLSLPLMARLNFLAGKLGIYAGPQISYLLSANQETEPDGYDTRDLFNDFDFSGTVGAEIDIVAGLLAGVRYNFSLSNIGSGDDISIDGIPAFTAPEEIGNGVFQIYAGFAF